MRIAKFPHFSALVVQIKYTTNKAAWFCAQSCRHFTPRTQEVQHDDPMRQRNIIQIAIPMHGPSNKGKKETAFGHELGLLTFVLCFGLTTRASHD